MLVERRFYDGYLHAADDRVTVMRPQAISDIHAIQVLRAGSWPPPPPPAVPQTEVATLSELWSHFGGRVQGHAREEFERDVKRMLERGWWRSNEEFAAVKGRVWKENEDMAWRLLNGE